MQCLHLQVLMLSCVILEIEIVQLQITEKTKDMWYPSITQNQYMHNKRHTQFKGTLLLFILKSHI